MDEGEGDPEREGSLFENFPNVGEQCFMCMTPWPSGEESYGPFFSDIYFPMSSDPLAPSPLSPDPFLRDVSEARAAFAHMALLRLSGEGQTDWVDQAFNTSLIRFAKVYVKVVAVMIQRFWRARRAGATSADKARFGVAMIVRPSNGATAEEREMRLMFIRDLVPVIQEVADF